MVNFKKYKIHLILIIAIGTGLYINTLNNPFVWDDEVIIVKNPIIKDFKYLFKAFTHDIFGSPLHHGNQFYRPLQAISYFFDYFIGKDNVVIYHLVNLLFHILNSILVYFILLQLKLSPDLTFLTSILFISHPIQTQAVSYISSRGDLLSTFFMLLTFLTILEPKFKVLGIIFFLLSILSKENSVVLPFIILFYYIIVETKKLKGKVKNNKNKYVILILLILISIIYSGIRLYFQKYALVTPLSFISSLQLHQKIFTLFRTIVTIFQLIFYPANLCSEYLFVEKSFNLIYFVLNIGIFILILISIKFLQIKQMLTFSLCWFSVSFAPFYNILFPLTATLRPHWLYFPSIGIFTYLVLLGYEIYKKLNSKIGKLGIKLSFYVWIIVLSIMTVRRNFLWSDTMMLYLHDVKCEPRSFTLWNNLGVEYFRKKDFYNAKGCFSKAIETSPGQKYDVAWNNLGVIYENENNLEKAVECYNQSIKLGNYNLAYSNLGRLYLKLGKISEAYMVLQEGKKLYPGDPEINYFLNLIKESDLFYKK